MFDTPRPTATGAEIKYRQEFVSGLRATTDQATPAHRESSPNYSAALFLLNDQNRVVLCSRGIQYILQRKYAGGFRGATWKPLSHHATRNSLWQACERLGLLSDASSQQAVAELPEYAHRLSMIAPKGGKSSK